MKMKIGLVSGLAFCLGCSSVAAPSAQQTVSEPSASAVAAVRPALVKVAVGQRQPLGQLTDIQGQVVDLQQPNKRKLLIFFATWCGDSKRLMQQLTQSPLLADKELLIVAIGREEQPQTLKEFAAEYKLPLHFIADTDRMLYQQFTDRGIPRVVLVNEQNVVVKTFLGEIPRAIDEIVWPGAQSIMGR